VHWRDLPSWVDRFRIEPTVAGLELAARVTLDADAGVPLARVRLEFGDGAATDWTAVVHEREIRHRYTRPGRYELTAWIEWGRGGRRRQQHAIDVRDPAGGPAPF
jgi:hypothetical protein